MNNEQIVLATRPKGVPQDDVFRFETIDVKAPEAGGNSNRIYLYFSGSLYERSNE